VCDVGGVVGEVAFALETQLLARLVKGAGAGALNSALICPLLDPRFKDLPGVDVAHKQHATEELVKAVGTTMAEKKGRAAVAPAVAVRPGPASSAMSLIAELVEPERETPAAEVKAYLSTPVGGRGINPLQVIH
jgi:hypothetical protein